MVTQSLHMPMRYAFYMHSVKVIALVIPRESVL